MDEENRDAVKIGGRRTIVPVLLAANFPKGKLVISIRCSNEARSSRSFKLTSPCYVKKIALQMDGPRKCAGNIKITRMHGVLSFAIRGEAPVKRKDQEFIYIIYINSIYNSKIA